MSQEPLPGIPDPATEPAPRVPLAVEDVFAALCMGILALITLANVALRVATKSVPGAIVVGSGLIAKKLYDRRKAAKTAKSGTAARTVKDTPTT